MRLGSPRPRPKARCCTLRGRDAQRPGFDRTDPQRTLWPCSDLVVSAMKIPRFLLRIALTLVQRLLQALLNDPPNKDQTS